jgi:cytochrome b561
MTLWFTARGAGLSALLLLSISTALGALMTGRGTASGRVVWHYVHRVTASLGLVVLALHITTILADPFAGVGWRAALIPFTSGYRPTWVGLGTLAVYTFVVVAALGAARGRFAATPRGAALWRQLHCLAYLGWAMAMWHGFISGTDSDVSWVRALYVLCGVSVVGAVLARLGRLERPRGLVRHDVPQPAQQLAGVR